MGPLNWFENVFFKRKEPLTLKQMQELGELELSSIVEEKKGKKKKKKQQLEILPGREHKHGRAIYMIVRYKGEVVGKAYTDRFEKIIPKVKEVQFEATDVAKLESYIKAIKKVCNPLRAHKDEE